MVLKRMSQLMNEQRTDRFVSALSELSGEMFDRVSYYERQKLNFVFRDQDLERQDG
jgi:hypothetical protein